MTGKKVLLIVGGGIAAYKSADLIRRLKERGIAVTVVLTDGGAKFVTPMTFAALSGNPVYQDIFAAAEHGIGHIKLSRESDLVVVAPATADLMAKMAAGLAGDLASAVLLASDKPILLAPSMNVRMWNHPATRRNVATLKADGIAFVGPDSGALACGEKGSGRMAEPAEIVAAIEAHLAGVTGLLSGLKAVVTAGPTEEAIDPVRYLANRSSGKQGYAIAAVLAAAGAETVLVSGPVALQAPAGVSLVKATSARDMLAACQAALPADIAVCAAAVADWRPEAAASEKIKKSGATPALKLVENPDILAAIAQGEPRPRLVIGFAAETEKLAANAVEKRAKKGCDWLMANDVSGGAVFGADRNRIDLVSAHGIESWPELSKLEVGARLVARIADALKDTP